MRRRARPLPRLLLSVIAFLGLAVYLLPPADPSASPGLLEDPEAFASAAAPTRAATCTPQLPSGTSTVQVDLDGTSYPVRVHVPQEAAGPDPGSRTRPEGGRQGTVPLVLDLHGSASNGTAQAQISGMDDLADAHGFVVAEPDAAIAMEGADPQPEGSWAWNVPGVPLVEGQEAPEDARDDVAFLAAVVDHLSQAACVDTQRVYATGFSGGGRMASALACARPDLVAAIAPVAGLRAGRVAHDDPTAADPLTCDPASGVAVMTFHGTEDWVNPYEGGSPDGSEDSVDSRWGYSVDAALERWAQLNRCTQPPAQTSLSEQVTLTSYEGCQQGRDVQAYVVAGAGHTWPGTTVNQDGLGATTQEISASELMWEFFAQHAST